MSFAEESLKLGRIPFEFVELEMDYGGCTYGVAPCTAAVGVTGEQKCFNTYGTCQDKENYIASSKTYRFCHPNAALPVGVQAFPLLKKLSLAPQVLTPGKGLGVRASLTVRFADMPHHDAGIDPYVSERDYVPEEQGTFWGKFRARNEFYDGRLLTVKTGYLGEAFSWDNFQSRVYVIDSLKGPGRDGEYVLVAKDVLKLADDNRALCPPPSTGRLAADIAAAASSCTLSPTGIGDEEYPAGSFRIVIGGEGIDCTRTAGSDVLDFTQRDVYGTGAGDHNEDDTVQVVKRIVSSEIQDVIYDWFTNYVPGFDPAWITKADWDNERDTFMPGLWTTDICEPVGVNTLLGELQEQGLCYVYWDEVNQQVRLRALRPPEGGLPVLREGVDFLEGTMQAGDDASQRISRVYILYDRKDPTKKLDEASNYRQRYVGADLESEGANEYGSSRIKTIYSRWFGSSSFARVQDLADTLLKRYSKPPRVMQFDADMSLINSVGLADHFQALTRQFQDATGANLAVNMQVVEQAQAAGKSGSVLQVKAQEYVWNERVTDTSNLRKTFTRNDHYELNLYEEFVAEFGTPIAGQSIEFVFFSGCWVGASTKHTFNGSSYSGGKTAVVLGDGWPAVDILITVQAGARIQGFGGDADPYNATTESGMMRGGHALDISASGPASVSLDNQGEIWGGGGAGASYADGTPRFRVGGGGAGNNAGQSLTGPSSAGFWHGGTNGTDTAGGTGGSQGGVVGGTGGAPGQPGGSGTQGDASIVYAAGDAGCSVIYRSTNFTSINAGDQRGPQLAV